MKELLSPTNDYVFGRLFGENNDRELLKDLLSAILPDINIKDIYIRSQVPTIRKLKDSKLGKMDITATLNDGTIVNIEMQTRDYHNTIDRSIFYGSGLYHDSLNKNENYNKIPRTICIWILNYDLFERGPFHEIATLKRDFENTILTDKVEYHYIQLSKFKKKCKRISSKLDEWLTFILSKDLEEIKKMDNEYIRRAGEKLEYMSEDEEERRIAELIEKGIRDEAAALAGARDEGLAEGEKKNKIQIAKKMLEEKLDMELIIKITGLTKEEIEKL